MSENGAEPGHGNSPAAWTAVTIILIAVSAGTLFFWFDQAVLVWASAGLAVAGLALGWVLRLAGFGVNGKKVKGAEH